DQSNRVRRVSTEGIVTTIAGNGTPGFSGDGGPGDDAQLRYPTALAVDDNGNLFIADNGNGRIRKVSPDLTITTVAGVGIPASGPAQLSGDGGPAISAQLGIVRSIAVDAGGNLLIAAFGGNHGVGRIRRVSSDGVITTIAGNDTCCYSGDGGPAGSAA